MNFKTKYFQANNAAPLCQHQYHIWLKKLLQH